MNNIKKLFFAAVMLCGGCAAMGHSAEKEIVIVATLNSYLLKN